MIDSIRKRGASLVELMVAMAIIGVVLAIVFSSLGTAGRATGQSQKRLERDQARRVIGLNVGCEATRSQFDTCASVNAAYDKLGRILVPKAGREFGKLKVTAICVDGYLRFRIKKTKKFVFVNRRGAGCHL